MNGFFQALAAFDGTPGSLQSVLNWVPPSRRQGSAQDFATLVSGATQVRFKLDRLSVGSVSTDGDSAKIGVQGRLEICTSGSVGTQSFDRCQPAPITPNGAFDEVNCLREQGQWYVADYTSAASVTTSSSGGSTTTATPPPPTPDTGIVPPTPDPGVTASGAQSGSASTT